ncbi:hypothetical protein [Chitinophaga terrae (ex Kim and Jung 2007)]|uniref:hypothetical protein n=1 Tax=Chitinophaga terrae (ex Kim and Jung 2007) TaxID=408074 RepID=UPI00119554EF|nr:hypothetical protein [Chitinophaga terrae (ex Kim and Jung 2007)]GEP93586.1 hypothetical protein CTE07_52310 [Chitinophaga terrae (ex Kim and Jung 2007)]
MAIVIGDQSKCFVCGQVLNDKESIEMFPPFVANMNDPDTWQTESGKVTVKSMCWNI